MLVRFSEDGQFGFVEGSNTGLPVSEILPAEAPEQLPPQSVIREVLGGFERGRRSQAQGGNVRQDVFSITEGDVVLSWPASLSSESIEEIKDWLKIAERKIARSEAKTEPGSPQTDSQVKPAIKTGGFFQLPNSCNAVLGHYRNFNPVFFHSLTQKKIAIPVTDNPY